MRKAAFALCLAVGSAGLMGGGCGGTSLPAGPGDDSTAGPSDEPPGTVFEVSDGDWIIQWDQADVDADCLSEPTWWQHGPVLRLAQS